MCDLRCITGQSDFTLTVERRHPAFVRARDLLMRFAELVKCPEYLHTYRITKLSLWNAASLGLKGEELLHDLEPFLKFPLPASVCSEICDAMALWGLLQLTRKGDQVYLTIHDPMLYPHVIADHAVRSALYEDPSCGTCAHPQPGESLRIDPMQRGRIKVALMKLGLPVEDIAGYQDGAAHPISLKESLTLRAYQEEAVSSFHRDNSLFGGSGIIVLPCGAGKTVVGLAVMAKLQMMTLVLATNTTALRQWKRELLDKTDLSDADIGEYSGNLKEIRPITLATYNILTSRRRRTEQFRHFAIFDAQQWGLVIYDEVHLLPAPLFQVAAALQARRRLGLTATLVREDGKESDVFSLIGPKKHDVPWKVLEEQDWIAKARCIEVSVPFVGVKSGAYCEANSRDKFRMAACNPAKMEALRMLLDQHKGRSILIIGMFLDQVRCIAAELNAPLLEGRTPQRRRDEIYSDFQRGKIPILVLSKVGNSSVDLPDAQVAIQVSGTFGSRQEEAQRLGRILRPKPGENQAFFYSLVSASSREAQFALNRQLYLVEQGYEYEMIEMMKEAA